MTQQPDLFAALAAPFDPSEVKVRTQNSRLLHYITARTVMNRLDSVLGPECWWDRYVPAENSVLCELTIRLQDGSTLTKSDAGGYAGMSDSGDDDKSGYSDAFKRAAVKFGVARYLYRDGVPAFVLERTPAAGVEPRIAEPEAPAKAPERPVVRQASQPAANGHAPANGKPRRTGGGGNGNGTPAPAPATVPMPAAVATADRSTPTTGKALWAWIKDREQQLGIKIFAWANRWGVARGFASRIIDWSPEQVALAFAEITRKLEATE